MTTTYIENPAVAAARLRREVWGDVVPVDPAHIAHGLGLQVIEARLSDDVAGALVKRVGQDPHIYVNAGDSANRRRFTCAHELGHYVMRREASDQYEYYDFRNSFSSSGVDSSEVYANQFAAELLMPAEHVKELASQELTDLELALRFGVSREAMQFRLKNLGVSPRGD